MTTLDDRLIPRVLEIVKRYGKTVTFTVPGAQAYDPATGKNTITGATTYTKQVTPPQGYSPTLVDKDLADKGDLQVFLPAMGLEFTPNTVMKVTVDGQIYTIVTVGPIYTGERIALYELQLRK